MTRIQKLGAALLALALPCAGILLGASKPKVADAIVPEAAASSCAYLAAQKIMCHNDGCTYASFCRPTVCPLNAQTATKAWYTGLDPSNFNPLLNDVTYRALPSTVTGYPACDAFFNVPSNWH